MKCPSEIELNEFAEDRLESRRRWEVQEHLTQCAGCRTDLEGLQWAGEQLAALEPALPGAEHPADEDLAALAEGKVAPDRKAELLSHLSNCAECAWLFGRLPRKSRKLAVPTSWYSFAAAAVLLFAVGLFAFNGQFSGSQRPEKAAVAKVETVKQDGAMAKGAPGPVAERLAPAAAPAPKLMVAAAPATAPEVVARHGGRKADARRAVQPRRGQHGHDNMQIAMNPPQTAYAPQPKSLSEPTVEEFRAQMMEDKAAGMARVAARATTSGAGSGAGRPFGAMAVQPKPAAAPGAVQGFDGGGPAAPPQADAAKPQPVQKTAALNEPEQKATAKAAKSRLPGKALAGLKQKVAKPSTAKSEGKARVKCSGMTGQGASGAGTTQQHSSPRGPQLGHADSHHHLAQQAPTGPGHA